MHRVQIVYPPIPAKKGCGNKAMKAIEIIVVELEKARGCSKSSCSSASEPRNLNVYAFLPTLNHRLMDS